MHEPDRSQRKDPKEIINEKLIRIKSEKDDSLSLNYGDEDLYESQDSQFMLPGQQFFQELDNDLNNLPRDLFIKELQQLCNYDEKRIALYREYLHYKANTSDEYPNQKLISRKNSNKSKKTEKYAQDCYVIFRYIQGERSGEIYDVFCTTSQANESVIVISDTHQTSAELQTSSSNKSLQVPDVVAMVTQIRDDVTEIKKQQRREAEALQDLSLKMDSISNVQSILLSSINGVRANQQRSHTASITDTVSASLKGIYEAIEGIRSHIHARCKGDNCDNIREENSCNDVELENEAYTAIKVTADMADMAQPSTSNVDVTDITSITPVTKTLQSQAKDNQNSSQRSNTQANSVNVSHNVQLCRRYSDAVTLPPNISNCVTSDNAKGQHTSHINTQHTDRPTDTDNNGGKFVAVTRRRPVTYHVSNIDPDVTEADIDEYITSRHVTPKQIKMFYHGYRSASAKVVLPSYSIQMIESDGFWPEDVVVRRWKSKVDWENELRGKRGINSSKSRSDFRHDDSSLNKKKEASRRYRRTHFNDDVEEYVSDDRQTQDQYMSGSGRDYNGSRSSQNSGWGHDAFESWDSDDTQKWYNTRP